LHRSLSRSDRFDYPFAHFAQIGEQEVLVKELYSEVNTLEEGDEVFGYIPRYAEMMTQPNTFHGDFRTTHTFWHMGRLFGNKPLLNQEFLDSGIGDHVTRPFAVQDPLLDVVYAHVFNNVSVVRGLPKLSNPRL
jgi:hypothetical protein